MGIETNRKSVCINCDSILIWDSELGLWICKNKSCDLATKANPNLKYYLGEMAFHNQEDYRKALLDSEFSRAYLRWTNEEEEELLFLFREKGLTLKELSYHFKRRKGGIKSRLIRLGLHPDMINFNLKEDFKKIFNLLDKYNIKKLYHFTDERNIKSIIKEEALLSIDYLEQQGITYYNADYNPYRLHISLSFTPDHPMKYVTQKEKRIQNPIIIEIDSYVMLLRQTMYSNGVANAGDSIKGADILSLENIDLERLGSYHSGLNNNSTYEIRKSEVLVKDIIKKEYILNFNKLRERYIDG